MHQCTVGACSCSSFVVENDHEHSQSVGLPPGLPRCVRRWLTGPIWARKLLPQVGPWWVGVDVALFFWPCVRLFSVLLGGFCQRLCSSAVMAPWVTMRRQQGLSEASDSQDSVLISNSFRETLRLSLQHLHWPLTVRLP